MSGAASVVGLSCPTCGAPVPLVEGARVVACPSCGLDSLLVGDDGVLAYHVAATVDRDAAKAALDAFLSTGNRAFDLRRRARVQQLFLAWVPYWRVPAWVGGWRFGRRWEGDGDDRELVPRELRVASERIAVRPACDVGEIGVRALDLGDADRLAPCDRDALARSGMVFAPVQGRAEALEQARADLLDQARAEAPLDELTSEHLHVVGAQLELVWFPLWIARYAYRGRVYQVVIDAADGTVRYGRAPGSALYRAAALVGGFALGTAVLVSGPIVVLLLIAAFSDDSEALALICAPLTVGPAIMAAAWGAFRFGGEQVHEAQVESVAPRRRRRKKQKKEKRSR